MLIAGICNHLTSQFLPLTSIQTQVQVSVIQVWNALIPYQPNNNCNSKNCIDNNLQHIFYQSKLLIIGIKNSVVTSGSL